MAEEERPRKAPFSLLHTVKCLFESANPSEERNCYNYDNDTNTHHHVDPDTYHYPSPAQWEQLPPEILATIFSYLDLDDKQNVEATCLFWRQCCHIPSLWSEMIFHFSGDDSIDVLAKAYRLIECKGHYLRSLVIKIGLPSLTQAWGMSQCVQHLLRFISYHPASQNIEHFSLNNLNFSNEWRFFTVSKNKILLALSDFLSRQRKLKSIDLTFCRLSAPNGMRLLQTLKHSPCRYTVQHIDLHGFFRGNYKAVHGSRFSILLYTSLFALQEIGIDAKHLDDKTLRRLTEKSVCRLRLRRLKIFFDADKAARPFISKQSWLDARDACPDLRVSVHVCGWMPKPTSKTLWAETMPLSHCDILWAPSRRQTRSGQQDLSFLIQDVGERYPTVLESFKLNSCLKSNPEVDSSILFLVTRCPYLTDINIVMDNLFKESTGTQCITNITTQRPFKVNVSLCRRNIRHGT